MKLNKTAIIVSIITLCFIFNDSNLAAATAFPEDQSIETNKVLEMKKADIMSQIERKDTVIIDGEPEILYPIFSNQEEALKQLKLAIPDLLNKISETYELNEINDSNWLQYVGYASEIITSEEDPQYRLLLSFTDIYENKAKNEAIVQLVDKLNDSEKISLNSTEDLENIQALRQELVFTLPYTSKLASEENKLILQAGISPTSSIDMNRAMQYINLYVETPNTDGFGNFGKQDCTNFASQILYAGNVRQEDYYPSQTRGWWHRKLPSSGPIMIPDHKYSTSWINADTFARYMGVGYTSTSHYSFSSNIQKGDLIALDYDRDGDWNHIGFVTNVDTVSANYGGYTYYDYKVAQHSNNYHAWTSSSTNGWETATNVNYGRVRR